MYVLPTFADTRPGSGGLLSDIAASSAGAP